MHEVHDILVLMTKRDLMLSLS